MYNFTDFIETLNNSIDTPNIVDVALGLVKDDFHLGKIVTKGDSPFASYVYIGSSQIEKEPIVRIFNHGISYEFYKRKDDYIFTKEDIQDINVLLKLLSAYHNIFILSAKVDHAKYFSQNTNLLNIRGYIGKIKELSKRVDVKKYNTYFINLRSFGFVNKTYDSEVGDKLIIEYANSLYSFTEDDEAVGHLGGDNFVAFIKRTRHDDFVKIASNANFEIIYKGKPIKIDVTGVIGYDEIKSDIVDHATIIASSSIPCQFARANKKMIVKLTDELVEMVNSVKKIESTFNTELEQGNFIVYYQPKFNVNTGKIVGVEALSRWVHDGQVLSPGIFVPILEKNGDIVKLDLYVLENLCKDIHNYRSLGHNIVPASCNLSRRDLEIENIEQKVINIIKKYNVKTEDIVIEVTETTNYEEKERLANFIKIMHENGIMTSIDDFGTGYSSLSVLRDFKVNEIKIDKSFIDRKKLSKQDEIIIGSIIDMAKKLNLGVICEGVETKDQEQFLLKLGCNMVQGFLYSKPVPKLEFESMLQKIGTYHDIN